MLGNGVLLLLRVVGILLGRSEALNDLPRFTSTREAINSTLLISNRTSRIPILPRQLLFKQQRGLNKTFLLRKPGNYLDSRGEPLVSRVNRYRDRGMARRIEHRHKCVDAVHRSVPPFSIDFASRVAVEFTDSRGCRQTCRRDEQVIILEELTNDSIGVVDNTECVHQTIKGEFLSATVIGQY